MNNHGIFANRKQPQIYPSRLTAKKTSASLCHPYSHTSNHNDSSVRRYYPLASQFLLFWKQLKSNWISISSSSEEH